MKGMKQRITVMDEEPSKDVVLEYYKCTPIKSGKIAIGRTSVRKNTCLNKWYHFMEEIK